MSRGKAYPGVEGSQYVVIAGYDSIYYRDCEYEESGKRACYENNFTMCLGVYDNVNEAYGRAYLYLEGLAHDSGEDYYISQMANTEDTGYRFVLVTPEGEKKSTLDWVWILFNFQEEDNDRTSEGSNEKR